MRTLFNPVGSRRLLPGPQRVPPSPIRSSQPHSIVWMLALASFFLGSCAAGDPGGMCRAKPLGVTNVFLENNTGAPPSTLVRGHLTSVDGPAEYSLTHLTFRDSAGGEQRVALSVPGVDLPIVIGRSYEALLEYVGGAPVACGVILRDSVGVVLATASDQSIGGHVLRNGVPGWTLELVPSKCPGREHGRCEEAITNSILKVTHEGKTVTLWNGQSARMGPSRVLCLTAQRVRYKRNCADAGLHQISWVILRE